MNLSNLDPQDANFIGQSGFTEATRADYQPGFLDGAGDALISGIESGASIASQSGIKGVIASNMQQLSMLHPEESAAIQKPINQAIDTSFTNFRKGIAPDAETTGKAGQILFGLGQYFPALAGAVVNPVLGAGVAQQISQTATTEELTGKGVSQQDAENIALPKSFVDAAGFLLPAAVGGRLVTRLASGAGINMAAGAASREVTNLMLQDKNYSAVAEQYKAWDGEAMIVDGILGAAFGGIHHLTSRASDATTDTADPVPVDREQTRQSGIDSDQETASGSEADIVQEVSGLATTGDVSSAVDETSGAYRNWLDSVRSDASQLISRGDRKLLAGEIHRAEYALSQIAEQRQALRDQRVGNSSSRRIRNRDIATLDRQAQEINNRIEPLRQALANNSPGGRFYDARANLSRIEQGIIPDGAPVRQSDVDAALAMNEAHNHDIAASPVLHGTPESMDAHYRAMGDAAESIARGDPVDVLAHVDSFDGHIRPEAFNDSTRPEMESALHENDIGTAAPMRNRQPQRSPEEGEAQFSQFLGDEGSVDPDTGVNLGNSYELATASRLAEEIPDLTVEHPDTGQQVKLSDLMDEYNDKIATSQDSTNVFPFVASCMLRNPE
ncbi:hypothetical protein RZP54_17915 [Raoultella ornithinolytica]|uniref:hypothetical protein n=1 Tax=Raoultella ornithinolytica TaxID=54291 RepID=UPI0010D9EA0E|nr:hypothetical protein [Raoultella ornithinolytica]MDV0590838.1 hypothetical protein [Raoultella ornithinolytica]VTN41385.1 Uncharacterised protein [Raoultella ornithinolytica]